jgi:hypothetical protein
MESADYAEQTNELQRNWQQLTAVGSRRSKAVWNAWPQSRRTSNAGRAERLANLKCCAFRIAGLLALSFCPQARPNA